MSIHLMKFSPFLKVFSNVFRSKLQQLIGDRLLCLQFHDIDFSTERNLVSLYRFVVDSKDSRIADPRNILAL